MTDPRRAPILFQEGDPALDSPAPDPAAAPQPDDDGPEPATLRALKASRARGSALARWFWGAAAGFVTLALSVAAYDFIAGLIARNPLLGALAGGLAAAAALAALGFAAREAAALSRLGRIDAIRAGVARALAESDHAQAQASLAKLKALYAARPDRAWALADIEARAPDLLDAPALVEHAEQTLMRDLDARAQAAVGEAARSVAAATALIPMTLVDVLAALALNLRMIRAVAEIYGGRAGWLGSWRLLKLVAAHIVATGAVAMGDDMLGAAFGGGVASKLSRRFGEGLINGALTARIGAAAIEVCRPMPFHALPRPSARGLAASALRGLFGGRTM